MIKLINFLDNLCYVLFGLTILFCVAQLIYNHTAHIIAIFTSLGTLIGVDIILRILESKVEKDEREQ